MHEDRFTGEKHANSFHVLRDTGGFNEDWRSEEMAKLEWIWEFGLFYFGGTGY
jgi:hypothetical protein